MPYCSLNGHNSPSRGSRSPLDLHNTEISCKVFATKVRPSTRSHWFEIFGRNFGTNYKWTTLYRVVWRRRAAGGGGGQVS